MYILLAVLLLIPLQSAPNAAAADSTVGSVKSTQGVCLLLRGTTELPLHAGQQLQRDDRLRTGSDGKVGLILRDNTVLALGPNTEIRVRHFLFDPAAGKMGMVLEMLRGVVSYISGQIAKLSPDSIQFVTPVATVGVRGTRFLARVTPE